MATDTSKPVSLARLLLMLDEGWCYCEYCKPQGFKSPDSIRYSDETAMMICCDCDSEMPEWVTLGMFRMQAQAIRQTHKQIREEGSRKQQEFVSKQEACKHLGELIYYTCDRSYRCPECNMKIFV